MFYTYFLNKNGNQSVNIPPAIADRMFFYNYYDSYVAGNDEGVADRLFVYVSNNDLRINVPTKYNTAYVSIYFPIDSNK